MNEQRMFQAIPNQHLCSSWHSFVLIDKLTLPLLFKLLVCPHLEYGNLIWGPFNREDQQAVERMHRQATRLVPSIRHREYRRRLQILKLPSLFSWRKHGIMIHVYQMLHAGVDVDASKLVSVNTGGATRGHCLRLFKPHASCHVRWNAFAVCVINDWNGLSADVVVASTLDTFKNRLHSPWKQDWYSFHDADWDQSGTLWYLRIIFRNITIFSNGRWKNENDHEDMFQKW